MFSLNRAQLIGRLGKDPEVRAANNGKEIVTFSVATSESWTDASGQKKEKTEWHNVVVFAEGLAGFAKRSLHKGARVYVEGQIHTRKWQGKDGQDKYTTEIVLQRFGSSLMLLDAKPEAYEPPEKVEKKPMQVPVLDDDAIPF